MSIFSSFIDLIKVHILLLSRVRKRDYYGFKRKFDKSVHKILASLKREYFSMFVQLLMCVVT